MLYRTSYIYITPRDAQNDVLRTVFGFNVTCLVCLCLCIHLRSGILLLPYEPMSRYHINHSIYVWTFYIESSAIFFLKTTFYIFFFKYEISLYITVAQLRIYTHNKYSGPLCVFFIICICLNVYSSILRFRSYTPDVSLTKSPTHHKTKTHTSDCNNFHRGTLTNQSVFDTK